MMTNSEIRAIFNHVLPKTNWMTPNIVEYGQASYRLIYEISTGIGPISKKQLYGVTFLECFGNTWEVLPSRSTNPRSHCFYSLEEAREYIENTREAEV